jgi:hypothetical protein
MGGEMADQIERATHFTVLIDGVIDDERLGKNELLVYMALCRFSDKERTAFPGIRKLANKARLSPNTVQEALQNLKAFGYLKIENRNRGDTKAKTSNLYTLVEYQSPTQGVSVTDTPPVSATDTEVDTPLEVDTKGEAEDNATTLSREPPEPPPKDNKLPEKMTREIFRQSVLNVLRENNPAVPTPYETDYKAAEDAAREYGSQVYLKWLTENSKKHPAKRLFFLHEDYLPALEAARKAEAARAEKKQKRIEKEANRCPHGHLDPKVCRECFFEDNPRSENLLADLPKALRRSETPEARANRERDKLKAV